MTLEKKALLVEQRVAHSGLFTLTVTATSSGICMLATRRRFSPAVGSRYYLLVISDCG